VVPVGGRDEPVEQVLLDRGPVQAVEEGGGWAAAESRRFRGHVDPPEEQAALNPPGIPDRAGPAEYDIFGVGVNAI
jgi:hypothetical protein